MKRPGIWLWHIAMKCTAILGRKCELWNEKSWQWVNEIIFKVLADFRKSWNGCHNVLTRILGNMKNQSFFFSFPPIERNTFFYLIFYFLTSHPKFWILCECKWTENIYFIKIIDLLRVIIFQSRAWLKSGQQDKHVALTLYKTLICFVRW